MPWVIEPTVRRPVAWLVADARGGAGTHLRRSKPCWVPTANVAAQIRLTLLLFLPGCPSIGPGTVPRDRVGYITALAESWKEQTLLNVVRMRYGDAPGFLDVSSVISGYAAIQGQLAAGAAISSDLTATIPSNQVTLGGNVTYLDRPTITYTPLTGDKFAKSLLRPIPPSAIFELIQAGYPADLILLMTTRAINGVYNRSSAGGRTREPDADFYPLLDALRRLQLSGAVSLRLEKHGADDTEILIFSGRHSAEVDSDLAYVRKILGVVPGKSGELTLTFGALPRGDKEIAVLSRSMLEILLEVSYGVDVPEAHVSEGRTAAATRFDDAQNPRDRPLVYVQSSASQPPQPFAAVTLPRHMVLDKR